MIEKQENEKISEEDKRDGLRRREFLEILGASFAALSVSGCQFRAPEEKIIPFIDQPENGTPGLSHWYSSTCQSCSASCGLIAKVRDGRPIKLEGNPDHPLSKGGLCARGQASVLDLYDAERLKGPFIKGEKSNWSHTDKEIQKNLLSLSKNGGKIRVITQTISSPSLQESLSIFKNKFPKTETVVYDSISHSSILDAHKITHGKRILPHYRFERAKVIVSFDADFLGTWISPVEFTKEWVKNRKPDKEWDLMSWHGQFETRVSITGANADLRQPIRPSEVKGTIFQLGKMVADHLSWKGSIPAIRDKTSVSHGILSQTASMLVFSKSRSLVISGSTDTEVQILVNWINGMLGNYGNTLDLEQSSFQAQGNDKNFDQFVEELEKGEIGALIVLSGNPVYDSAQGEKIKKSLQKVPLTISFSDRMDETARLMQYVCPNHHFLESWGDNHPVSGIYSIVQPMVSPLYNTRSMMESLLKWADKPMKSYDFVRSVWRKKIFPQKIVKTNFNSFWEKTVQSGVVSYVDKKRRRPPKNKIHRKSLSRITSSPKVSKKGIEIVTFPSVALFDGRQSNNPWLQELPDPITKVTWGNVASFSPKTAKDLKIEEGRVVEISQKEKKVTIPAHIQVGLPDNIVTVALGYGRDTAGKISANYPMEKLFPLEKDLLSGASVFPLDKNETVQIKVQKRVSALAKTQQYDFLDVPFMKEKRPVIHETNLQDYYRNPKSGHHDTHAPVTLWPKHEYKGSKWEMAIDLNSCTGCSACVLSCQAENNIPVVGKAEVRKGRDMQWIRIDRYYTGKKESQEKTPDTAFQPMLCQQCDNAPCETVCPVLATLHSKEGLNMMVYNRCVGTRYCANNCPYKVRRFNWFDYAHKDLVQNLVLNPDVTVRERGVMEKCSFCVQRIADSKSIAKDGNRKIRDGEIQTACMQSCPANAIVFGDANDPNSQISKIKKNPRNYSVLSELGVGPNIHYMTKVRNKKV